MVAIGIIVLKSVDKTTGVSRVQRNAKTKWENTKWTQEIALIFAGASAMTRANTYKRKEAVSKQMNVGEIH